MLNMRVNLIHNPSYLYKHECEVVKVIELDALVFDTFVNNPAGHRDFIEENRELMYRDTEGTYHCILVLGVGTPDGALVCSEGFDYARFASYVPHARAYVEREAQQFADECLGITPNDDGSISVYLEDIENFTGASVTTDNCLVRMFLESLKNHHRIAKVTRLNDYDCIVITLADDILQRDTCGTPTAD